MKNKFGMYLNPDVCIEIYIYIGSSRVVSFINMDCVEKKEKKKKRKKERKKKEKKIWTVSIRLDSPTKLLKLQYCSVVVYMLIMRIYTLLSSEKKRPLCKIFP